MGFRISAVDVAMILAGSGLAWLLWKPFGQLAFLPLVLLFHFFLFCNVFRIHRWLELTWAALFILNFGIGLLKVDFNWRGVLMAQSPWTFCAIAYEILHPRYHGIFAPYVRRFAKGELSAEGKSFAKSECSMTKTQDATKPQNAPSCVKVPKPKEIDIILHAGDICAAPADIICVSTNPQLELMAGTGGAVREAGGWGIHEECKAIMDRKFDETGLRFLGPGTVIRTSAGQLPYKGILMCVASGPFHESSVDVIARCVRGALECAEKEFPDARAIAMPVFASGFGQFDFADALDAMIHALEQAKSGHLMRCLIVLNDSDQMQLAQQHIMNKSTALTRERLPEYAFAANEYGWTGSFPGEPRHIFEKEFRIQIEARFVPCEPRVPAPVSANQATLLRAINPALPEILEKVEEEMVDYNLHYFDPNFREFITDPHVSLSWEEDDGESWTFVFECMDSDFGYQLEFKGTKFSRIWAGD